MPSGGDADQETKEAVAGIQAGMCCADGTPCLHVNIPLSLSFSPAL